MAYYQGVASLLQSAVDFVYLELSVKHEVRLGARGTLALAMRGGMFLNDRKMYFMDYKHFPGILTPFTTNDPVGGFRLLDYYMYSTADRYFTGNVHYQIC